MSIVFEYMIIDDLEKEIRGGRERVEKMVEGK